MGHLRFAAKIAKAVLLRGMPLTILVVLLALLLSAPAIKLGFDARWTIPLAVLVVLLIVAPLMHRIQVASDRRDGKAYYRPHWAWMIVIAVGIFAVIELEDLMLGPVPGFWQFEGRIIATGGVIMVLGFGLLALRYYINKESGSP